MQAPGHEEPGPIPQGPLKTTHLEGPKIIELEPKREVVFLSMAQAQQWISPRLWANSSKAPHWLDIFSDPCAIPSD